MHSVKWNTFSYNSTDLIRNRGTTSPILSYRLKNEIQAPKSFSLSHAWDRQTLCNALNNEGKLHGMGLKNTPVSLASGAAVNMRWQWRWEMTNYSWCRRWLTDCLVSQIHAHCGLCLNVRALVAERNLLESFWSRPSHWEYSVNSMGTQRT